MYFDGFEITFGIDITPPDIKAALRKDVRAASDVLIRELTDLAPIEMRALFGPSPSPKGSPPGIKTGNLSRSLVGTANGLSGEIRMAFYAEYLDSFFGGGLERDFVEKGIDNALVRVAAKV